MNIPMHYDTFDLIRADPAEFVGKVETADAARSWSHPAGTTGSTAEPRRRSGRFCRKKAAEEAGATRAPVQSCARQSNPCRCPGPGACPRAPPFPLIPPKP